MDELFAYDAVGLGELIRNGDITAGELLESTIQRIEKTNPKLNAVIYQSYEIARKEASACVSLTKEARAHGSTFLGVPFLLKDLLAEWQGNPICEGSRAVEGYVSKLDGEIVRRYKASGLIIVGRTNASEFGVSPSTEPLLHGPTYNPWDTRSTPGGSSGGSAAAVAAGIVPMAHGNDAGGSIRIPASCCGVFGLKPTRGRNPLGPLFGDLGGGIVHEHALTLTVRDSAALLDASSGPEVGDPYRIPPPERPFSEEIELETGRLRIGFLTSVPEGWNDEKDLHRDCEAAVEDAAHLCEDLGHVVQEISPDDLAYPNLAQAFGVVFICLVGQMVAYWERELKKTITQDLFEPTTWEFFQHSKTITGAAYLDAQAELQRFSRKVASWYQRGKYDVLLSPTMRIPPTEVGSFQPVPYDLARWIGIARSFIAFTRTQNVTGQPAMSVPLYWNCENIPIGVQFAGRFGDEATLFRLAAQLERARPWAAKRPPIHSGNVG